MGFPRGLQLERYTFSQPDTLLLRRPLSPDGENSALETRTSAEFFAFSSDPQAACHVSAIRQDPRLVRDHGDLMKLTQYGHVSRRWHVVCRLPKNRVS